VKAKSVYALTVDDLRTLFADAGHDIDDRGNYFLTQCPAHDDQNPSLKVAPGDSHPTVLTCYAGCSNADVWHWIEEEYDGVGHKEFTASVTRKKRTPRAPGVLTLQDYATYLHVDEQFLRTMGVEERNGGIAFRMSERAAKLRVVDKDGNRSFRWDGGKSEQFPLFPVPDTRLPPVIHICEGETDAIIARYLGFEAFALTSGSSAAPTHLTHAHFRALKGLGVTTVVFVPDCDEQGRTCMARLAITAHEAELDLKWLTLDLELEEDENPFDVTHTRAKDLHGWFLQRDGQSVPDMVKELRKSTELYTPPASSDAFHEFLDAHEKPPVWVIPDLVARGDVVGIVAPPKSMKTYFMLHVIYCLSSKAPLFEQGRYTPAEPMRVMLVEEEGNADLFAKRLQRVGRFYGDEWTIPPRVHFKKGFTLEDNEKVEKLIWELNFFQIKVLVLDPWQRLTGERDESSSSETQRLWNRVFDIQREVPGLTIFIVHHARKDAEMNQNMVRGSSRFMGEIDTVVLLRKKEADLLGMVLEGRDHEGTEAGEEKLLKVHWDHEYQDVFRLDGNEFTETVTIHIGATDKTKKKRDDIFQYLVEQPDGKTYGEIEEKFDLGRDAARRHLTALLDDARVEKVEPDDASKPILWKAV
jgi:DNA-binding transcriptional ArsR family regulator